jgi:filamentous hemagglutinin family protein
MNNYSVNRLVSFGLFSIIGSFSTIPIIPIQAQNIAPANTNTTNTVVNPIGNQFNISGGALSPDGSNLFHDFQRFGLDAVQVANFLANPNIQNILGRVSGGEVSLINGLIQVTGGNPNLYLMNPTGIVFGPNASLNVPASFSATTSSAIAFAGGIFNAVDANDFTTLNGSPTSFVFSLTDPSGVINAANLAVNAGSKLNLVGGTVINTGTLNATNTGNVSIVAVPNSSLVKITPTGSLLSIEVDASQLANGITTLTLPQILNAATTATINTGVTENLGQVTVSASGTNVNQGDIVTNGNLTSDNLRLAVAGTGNAVVEQALINSNSLTIETATGNISFKGAITTTGDFITKGSGAIEFTSSVTAAFLDTTTQTKTQLGGNVFTTGKQAYGNLQLDGANILLSTNGNEVKFNGTVDSKAGLSSNLSIDSPAGASITFTGKVGNANALGNITTTTAGLTEFKETVNAGIVKSDGSLGNTAFRGNVNATSVDTKSQATTQIGANITTTGTQSYGGAVTLANNPTLTGQGITFNDTVNGANQNLTVNSGTGDLEFKAAVGTAANPLGTLTTTAATSSISGEFNAAKLAVTSTTATNLSANVTTTDSQTYTGAVTLANNPTLTGQGITFNGTVDSKAGSSSNLSIISPTGANITFNEKVGSVNALGNITTTTSGLTEFKNTVNAGIIKSDGTLGITAFGGNVNAISVDIKSQQTTTQIGANITTTDTQNYGGAVTLANNPIFTGKGITFDVTVNGAGQNLTVNSGTGNLEFKAAVGTVANPLGTITTTAVTTSIGNDISDTVNATKLAIASTVATNLNANVTTSESQTYIGAVTLANNPVLTSKDITFNGTVNGAGQNLTVNSIGNLDFKGKVGATSSLGTITTSADITTIGDTVNATKLAVTSTVATNINANVTTSDSQTYTGAVTLANNPILTGKGITFDDAVNGAGQNLTVNSGINPAGASITFTGKVGNANALGNITTTTAGLTEFKETVNAGIVKSDGFLGSTAFRGNVNAISVDTKSQATTQIGANITTTGTQDYGGATTFTNNPSLTGQGITFNGTVNGAGQNLTVNSTGNLDFKDKVGATSSLGTITTSADTTTIGDTVNATKLAVTSTKFTNLNANVTTSDSQTYTGAVNLGNNPTLTGQGITFNGTINGINQNLTVNSGTGNIEFKAAVGTALNPLGTITTTADTTTIGITTTGDDAVNATKLAVTSTKSTNLNANVTTSDSQTYTGAVNLGDNPTLTGKGITFNGTVNGTNQNLTVNSGSGTSTFSQQIGNAAPLTNLTTSGSKVELNANATTTGNQTFNSDLVELTGTSDRLLSSVNGTIQIANVLDAKSINLTLSAAEINFNGVIDSVRGTGNLTLETSSNSRPIVLGGTTNPSALTLTSQDLASASDLASIKSDFRTLTIGRGDSAANVSIDASGITLNNPSVTIQTGTGAIAVNGNIQNSGSIDLNAPLVNLGGDLTSTNSGILVRGAAQLSGINRNVNAGGNITFAQSVTGLATNFAATSVAQLNFNSRVSLLSLLTNANQVNLNSNVNTLADQTYNAPVFLTNDVAIAGNNLLFNSSIDANSRSLALSATNNITTQAIASQGRNVTLVSSGGLIKTGNISTSLGNVVKGGDVSISTTSNLIDTGSINTSGTAIGGTVDLKVNESGSNTVGAIKTGDINTNSSQQGGNIDLNAGQTITTGGINSSSISDTGGSILLRASQTITTREINSSSTQGAAGNVTIDPLKFTFDYINAEGGNSGGDVYINFDDTNTFRGLLLGTGTFSSPIMGNRLVTISTASLGADTGGDIAIKHTGTIDRGGGDFVTLNPFIIGSSSVNSGNGTFGAITTGSVTLTNESFFGSFTLGNLQILTGSGLDPARNVAQAANAISSVQASRIDNTSTIKGLVESIEQRLSEEFKEVGLFADTNKTFEDIKEDIKHLEEVSGRKTAILYVSYQPRQYLDSARAEVKLQKALITIETKPGEENLANNKITPNLNVLIEEFEDSARNLDEAVSKDISRSQQLGKDLYDAIFTDDLEAKLKAQGVQNLIIVTSRKLRTLPFAALYDGNDYLVEKYNLSFVPSLGLSNFREAKRAEPLENRQILAMGTSDFSNFPKGAVPDLSNVPKELSLITQQGNYYLDQKFTPENLVSLRQKFGQNILHIATHAVVSESPEDNNQAQSGIYFWDRKLPLKIESFRSLKLGKLDSLTKPVDLLVLSACQTADGDTKTELAFAGLAQSAGVKSVIATLWTIADESTPELMNNFYTGLRSGISISGSLRKAQIEMLKSREYFHPFYWAAFTLIGNP